MRILRAIKLKTLICVRSIDVTYHYLIWALIFKCHAAMVYCTEKNEISMENQDKRNKLHIKAPLRGDTYAATSSFDNPLKFTSR